MQQLHPQMPKVVLFVVLSSFCGVLYTLTLMYNWFSIDVFAEQSWRNNHIWMDS